VQTTSTAELITSPAAKPSSPRRVSIRRVHPGIRPRGTPKREGGKSVFFVAKRILRGLPTAAEGAGVPEEPNNGGRGPSHTAPLRIDGRPWRWHGSRVTPQGTTALRPVATRHRGDSIETSLARLIGSAGCVAHERGFVRRQLRCVPPVSLNVGCHSLFGSCDTQPALCVTSESQVCHNRHRPAPTGTDRQQPATTGNNRQLTVR
jgi:hypothetical protein